jgi:hypothetical protein
VSGSVIPGDFNFGSITRNQFCDMIHRMTAERSLRSDQREQLCDRLWSAYRNWGITAGYVAIPLPQLPADLTAAQRDAIAKIIGDGITAGIDHYRAVVLRERIELEISLLI